MARKIPPPKYTERVTAYVGDGRMTITGREPHLGRERLTVPLSEVSIPEILRVAPADLQRIYICGPKPGGSTAQMYRFFTHWLAQNGTEWRSTWRPDDRHPVLQIAQGHGKTGRSVEIRRITEWFGEDATPRDCAIAMQTLRDLLRREFGPHAMPLSSPAMTGLDLWDRTQDTDVPLLPPNIRDLIKITSGQGRIQIFPRDGEIPALWNLDARFAYASVTAELGDPSAVVWDHKFGFAGYTPGRYRIMATPPEDWRHLGIFGFPNLNSGIAWPPDPWGTLTWADGCEVMLAKRLGWKVDIHERLLFPGKNLRRPLDKWRGRIIRLRDEVEHLARTHNMDLEVAVLVLRALRAIVLHGIGAFARTGREEIVRIHEGASLSDYGLVPGQIVSQSRDGDFWNVAAYRPLSKWSEKFQHPEWAAQVWAKWRCRLLSGPDGTGALHVPRENIIAIMTDALYLTENPHWVDDGKPGRFRVKGHVPGPLKAPQTWDELYALRDQAQGVFV